MIEITFARELVNSINDKKNKTSTAELITGMLDKLNIYKSFDNP